MILRTEIFMAVAFAALALFFCTSAYSQEQETEVKGWSLNILPCASYSTEMGIQYGVFGDIYYYDDRSTYPDPVQRLSWEVSHYTKGRTRYYMSYDSKYLVPGLRLSCSAVYVKDPLYKFFGFNGAASYYDSSLSENKSDGISYYGMNRDMIRLLADVQGVITPGIHWAAGAAFWRFSTGKFSDRYGYDVDNTLYSRYVSSGLIRPDEASGGNRLELKGGLVYDTRNIEAAPDRGIWTEVYLNGSPELAGGSGSYLKLCAHWRQYITIPVGIIQAGEPVFAYHLAYQGTVAGKVPFYMQQNITTLIPKQMISEGFGSSNTVRGTYNNRIIADGYAWGNFELRVKLVRFSLFRQFFYLATNPFFDCGMVTKTFRASEMESLLGVKNVDGKARELVRSAGTGIKIAWNENFILSAEVAHNFNDNLGAPLWLSLITSYSF